MTQEKEYSINSGINKSHKESIKSQDAEWLAKKREKIIKILKDYRWASSDFTTHTLAKLSDVGVAIVDYEDEACSGHYRVYPLLGGE